MIILNDKRFCNEIFYHASTLKDIENSPTNSTIIFKYNENNIEIYKYCNQNNIDYGVEVSTIKEFIFIANLNAKYAFCEELNFASTLQKITDNYLIQTKIILKSSINELETAVLNEIDGIFVI